MTCYGNGARRKTVLAISIAMVTGSLSRKAGGLFYSARIPVNRMAALGLSPTVYGVRDEFWEDAASEWNVQRITAYDPIGWARLGIAPRMIRDLKNAMHDLVHLRGLWAFSSYAASRIRRTGVPLLISPEGMLDPWALSQSSVKKRIALHIFEAENLRRARVLHALSQSEAGHIRDFGLRNPIAIIPNGVDLPLSLTSRDRAHAPRILLFLGRIHPKKGLAELIEAWAGALSIAPELRRTWQVHIAGWDDGGHEEGLRERVRRLGLEDTIIFLGSLYGEVKDRALRSASAFILPSHGEGLPISALEAAAYGLPLFLTRHCNLPEFIDGGVTVQIEPDPSLLARELAAQLVLDYTLHEAAGAKAREIAAQRFSWSSIVDQYLLLYEWAAFGGAPPSSLNLC